MLLLLLHNFTLLNYRGYSHLSRNYAKKNMYSFNTVFVFSATESIKDSMYLINEEDKKIKQILYILFLLTIFFVLYAHTSFHFELQFY